MMEFNEELVEKIEFTDLDMGFVSAYVKEDGTMKMKAHSAFFKIDGVIILNNKFKVLPEYLKHMRIYLGKKGQGIVFSELFSTFLKAPGSVKYCYEMKRLELESERRYADGEY